MPLPIMTWLRQSSRRNRRKGPASGGRRRVLALERLETRDVPATWTALTNLVPNTNSNTGAQSMMLLSDGTIMIHGGADNQSSSWYRLTPNSSGSYINGTFTTLASSNLQRLFYTSDLLPNGKILVLGGEYSNDPNGSFTNTGEIYDPVANTWTSITNFPQSGFGDDPSEVLSNGTVLTGYFGNTQTYIWTPTPSTTAPGTWAATGSKIHSDRSDEESWVKLPDGSIVSYDVFNSPATGAGTAQRYIQSSGTWVDAGSVPVPLSGSAFGRELGPGLLLPPMNGATQGNVFLVGATSNTVLYTPPPAGSLATGSWAAGPVIPPNGTHTQGADDAPGALLPNGHVIFLVDTNSPDFTAPSQIFDYDPVANTLTQQTSANTTFPSNGSLTNSLNGHAAFIYYMLDLPNGDVLMSSSVSRQLWEFTPDGSPNAAWAPMISSIAYNSGLTYTLTGTQLNGMSEGANYGDDAQMASNYPIVRLTNGSNIYYARTANWSSTGVQTGSTPVTTQFTLPNNLPFATYQLSVVANGIASTPVSFVPPVYADTHWVGLANGTAVADADPVLTGSQAATVGANAFATVTAAIAAAPTGGVVIVNGNDGTGTGNFGEAVNVTKQVAMYLQEGAVSFGSLAGNVAGATIALKGVSLTAGGDNSSTEYDGTITGTTGLTKAGNGTLILTGANTYSGGTTISGGTLQVGNGATTGSITGAVTNNGTLVFNRSDAAFTFAGAVSGSGTILNSGTATLSGNLSGSQSVNQQSAGVLTLTAVNSFTGGTTVSAGKLKVGNARALGSPVDSVQVNAGATLDLNGFSVTIWTLTVSGTITNSGGGSPVVTMSSTGQYVFQVFSTAVFPLGFPIGTTFRLTGAAGGGVLLNADAPVATITNVPLDFGGVAREISVGNGGQWNLVDAPISYGGFNLTGGGTLSIQGTSVVTNPAPVTVTAGTLDLAKPAGVNAIGGDVTVAGGTLHLSADNQIADTAAVTVNSGTFDLNNHTETVGGLAGAGGTASLGTGTLTVNGANVSTFAGTIAGAGGLVLGGTGQLTLTGPNTYGSTGGTTINGGILSVNSDANLGDPSGQVVFAGGTLQALAGLMTARPVTLNAGGGTIDSGTFTVTVSAPINGAGGLTKSGAGTLVLSGTNGYTGPTTVVAGNLLVSGSLAAASAVSVAAGATLSGPGSVGATTVSGTLAPGNNVGVLTTGSLTFNPSGTLSVQVLGPTAGTNYSEVIANGPVNINGATLSLSVANNFTPAVGSSIDIVVNHSGTGITGTFAGLPEGATISAGGQNFTISYVGAGGSDIVLTAASAAPPPPTVANVQVNDGANQRSEVRSIAVTFSGPVTFAGGDANAAAAFQLQHLTDSTNVALTSAVALDGQGRTVVTLTFAGGETDTVSAQNGGAASLSDGRYQLTISSAAVLGAGFQFLAGGGPNGNYVSPDDTLGGGPGQLHLYRIFGDTNGDGIVDQQDLGQFRTAFNSSLGNPLYIAFLDANNDTNVDQQDLGQFRTRFNANVF